VKKKGQPRHGGRADKPAPAPEPKTPVPGTPPPETRGPFQPPGGPLECRTERRREEVRRRGGNGLDYVEVDESQTELCVHFLGHVPDDIAVRNVRLRGGRPVKVESIAVHHAHDEEKDDCLAIRLTAPGDFSTYRLCLVETDERGRETGRPFPGLDPRYACLCFSFKGDCPSDLDCLPPSCPEPPRRETEIDYLAKDYGSFKRVLFDRLALLVPDWNERHAPDFGVTLVELLAYVADHLSYAQDAVATEAYLATARRRISVRRHARLVDYVLHEGCNARAWLALEADADGALDLGEVFFITRLPGLSEASPLTEVALQSVPAHRYEVFEPLMPGPRGSFELKKAHNRIAIYTWGDLECCLPRGATSATLLDPERKLSLRFGDFLLFEEVLGPATGNPADADPTHRHAVRLTRVTPGVDALYEQPVVEVAWGEEDALPFPLCVSALGPTPACELLENVSVAGGNVLLVDHGRRRSEPLPAVPEEKSEAPCVCEGRTGEVTRRAGDFEPVLPQGPVTWAEAVSSAASAAALLRRDLRRTVPAVTLEQIAPPAPQWLPEPDLLESGPDDRRFAVEVDDLGLAHLRFGDGELGRRPDAGAAFTATYRVGNGPQGNVGSDTIAHTVFRTNLAAGLVKSVRNPLAAVGGTSPETLEEARLRAPHAFRGELQRAITADDYARLAERDPKVQRAAAALRWNGSWYEMTVGIDPSGKERADAALLDEVGDLLFPFRRVGHDLRVIRADSVPIRVVLRICVKPHYLRGHVEAELLDVLSNRQLARGRRGLFHPDELTFGDGVALNRIVAAAQAVEGVAFVEVIRFERQFGRPGKELDDAFLPLGPFQIARLENDPRAQGDGVLTLELRGGR